jgi:hypothetical protein
VHAFDEHWKNLCEQASIEQDPEKLLQLVQEINRALEERQLRIRNDIAGYGGTPPE